MDLTSQPAGFRHRRRVAPPASGRFVLRLDRRLHDVLRRDASLAGASLNDWCSRTLAAPGAGGIDTAGVVLEIRAWLGDDLEGVVLHGSFARGDHGAGSDIDLLAAVRSHRPITRDLYREWEGRAAAWNGRPVDLHIVHLPAAGDVVTGSWAEAAVCGIVLYDRNLAVARRLIGIRERIAAGRLLRRMSQGQPYWIDGDADAQP
jgi:predicted nucleotidyltransferase